ncbi:FecR domain-containing protein [Achromobacter xylosoxidans]
MADKTIAAAAQWYARLCADDASAADLAAHGRWLAADPEHARIWGQVERLRGTLGAAPARLAADTLNRADQHFSRRRAALRNGLGAVALLGAGGLAAWRALPMERMLADYRTGAGERRELRLADGTLLWLDSASAVDVTVDAGQRRIFVHAGEILVDTENVRPGLPPLRVLTAHGAVRPLGTRFIVTRQDDLTRVAVLRHAVALEPATGGAPVILKAGEQGTLAPAGRRRPAPSPASPTPGRGACWWSTTGGWTTSLPGSTVIGPGCCDATMPWRRCACRGRFLSTTPTRRWPP